MYPTLTLAIDVIVRIWYNFVFLIVNRLVQLDDFNLESCLCHSNPFNMPARCCCRHIRLDEYVNKKYIFFFPLKDHLNSIYRLKSRESKQQNSK